MSPAIKSLAPRVRLVGVEPACTPRMTQSLSAGHPVTVPGASGVADVLLAVRPGDLTFALIQAHVDENVTVDDGAILDAVRWIFDHGRLAAEPSGAAPVAAALGRGVTTWTRDGARASDPGNGPIAAVVSGGYVGTTAFTTYITAARQA